MNHSIKFKNHPFKFLLYLEWTLLVIAAFTELVPVPHPFPIPRPFEGFGIDKLPLLTLISLGFFAAMGLRLPQKNQITKVIYVALEILLIFLAVFSSGQSMRLFVPLYIIMVVRSCLMFQFFGRIIVIFISFILHSLTLIDFLYNKEYINFVPQKLRFLPLNIILSFGLACLFILLFMNAIISERQSRDKLAIANEKLRQYALRVENQATLEERSRIAREIHDSLGHSLTALNLQLETAIKLWESNPTQAKDFLSKAKELGTQALKDVRHSVSTLRCDPLQNQSLARAIAILVENFQSTTNILPKCQINIKHPVSPEVRTAIYRIIQESLTNISKHSQATAVTLKINTTPRNLLLIIQDNGRGFDLEHNTTGFGLQSIRDRTFALGGSFNIKAIPYFGCEITVDIPLS